MRVVVNTTWLKKGLRYWCWPTWNCRLGCSPHWDSLCCPIMPRSVRLPSRLWQTSRYGNTFTPKMFGPGKEREPGEAPASTDLTKFDSSHEQDKKKPDTWYIRTIPAIWGDDSVSDIEIRWRAYKTIGAHNTRKPNEEKDRSHGVQIV